MTQNKLKDNILQADPALLSAIAKLTECRASIELYVKSIVDDNIRDYMTEKANDFDEDIYSCMNLVADMLGQQVISLSESLHIK